MNWLFKSRKMAAVTQPAKAVRLSYPLQVVLLVENLEELTDCEKELYGEINTATSQYDIPLVVREYDIFNQDDIHHVVYLPSYHIYNKSRLKSTHSSSGKVEKRLSYWIKKYEKKFSCV